MGYVLSLGTNIIRLETPVMIPIPILIPMNDPKLTYRERNLVNVLSHTSSFTYSEIEELYWNTLSWDATVTIMDRAQDAGMSLNDALLPLPVIINH